MADCEKKNKNYPLNNYNDLKIIVNHINLENHFVTTLCRGFTTVITVIKNNHYSGS